MNKPQPYITWNTDAERATAMQQLGKALEQIRPVLRTVGTDVYLNAGPNNTSIRDGFSRRDWEMYRPGEIIPKRPKDIILACDTAADNNGIVNNVLNLMSDFTAKGIDVVHPNKRIDRFYKEWARRVGMKRIAERFAHYLYRHGTVFVRRRTAKINVKDEEQMKQATGEVDLGQQATYPPRIVPWQYNFMHPLSIELFAEDLAPFVGADEFIYNVKVPLTVANSIRNPKTPQERGLRNKLPTEVRAAVISGNDSVPLDRSKVSIYWYKRDSWKAWGKPIIYPILKDLHMLEKMKLADLAALDGAISAIRVWKLGSLEHKIMPHPSTLLRLADMLTSNVGGGVMDLFWGPDIELVETKTDAHHFLGSTKYAPTLQAIYSGLGIPQTLTGSETEVGFTNNYVSMKILLERLQHGRDVLKEFFDQEVRIVQASMGFRFPAKVVFDNMLTDDQTMHQLLLNMADRDLIDAQTLQEELGLDPELIEVRQRRERKKRDKGKMPPKASPFHNPNLENDLTKLFAGFGAYTPGQFGIELEDDPTKGSPPGQLAAKWKTAAKPPGIPGTSPKGQPGQGRPQGMKDASKRKQKTVKPRSSATFIQNLAAAEEQLGTIARLTTPLVLRAAGKKTLRELTDIESRDFENLKFAALCQFQIGESIEETKLQKVLEHPMTFPAHVNELLKTTVVRYLENNGKEPTLETLRRYQSAVFAVYRGNYGVSDGDTI